VLIRFLIAVPKYMANDSGVMAEHHGGGGCHLMVDRKQRGSKILETRYNLQRYAPSDPFSPASSHLLKSSPPPKIVPSTREKCSTH
jgi:hypothetical protein